MKTAKRLGSAAVLLFCGITWLPLMGVAQGSGFFVLSGRVTDAASAPLPLANVWVPRHSKGTVTSDRGEYRLEIPAGTCSVQVQMLGYQTQFVVVSGKMGQEVRLNVRLKAAAVEGPGISVEGARESGATMQRIDPRVAGRVVSPSGNFETILQGLGARTQSEFSSQYAVRGGNFDENLIYVNDIEIYRPVLMRSGQQEGMSFIHPDLVGNIQFSAGGFAARYGDRMSSVLDVQYRVPTERRVKAQLSMMGAGVTAEGADSSRRLTYQLGMRYRTLSNLLGSLDTRGEYQPSSGDVQFLLNYRPSARWTLGLLSHYSHNDFRVVPSSRETVFGTVKEALQLRIFFDGRERTWFHAYTGGLTAAYRPHPRLQLKWIGSVFSSDEREYFDVEGAWWLNQLDTELGSENFGKVAFTRGVGAYQNFARNQLSMRVAALEHRGFWESPTLGYVQWGLRAQRDRVVDRLYEWNNLDSAAFSVPSWQPGDSVVRLREFIDVRNRVESGRYTAYVQSRLPIWEARRLFMTAGVRANYWTWNREWLLSPRVELTYTPRWGKEWLFRTAWGLYGQPAFYREMRDPFGRLNPQVRAQRAWHYVLGADRSFRMDGRPFRFVAEAYYKDLRSIAPYELDNVRVRYLGKNNARGYATGLDLRINGEFVGNLQSWASLSWMKTAEIIEGAVYTDTSGETRPVGYIPRPTDQRVMANIMFQDLLPSNPAYQVNLNLVVGSALPYGVPDFNRVGDTLRMPFYRRVDIGFSRCLVGEGVKRSPAWLDRSFRSLWLNVEVFNLLQVSNTISYLWIMDTEGYRQNVPNYLSGRLLNLRLVAEL
ncbi:MAG: carboxypeptidase-like regulatory domain-containing protein [Bacteroidetes bacterium]|nr:carboxypeptidase-like regulatory domain-containing protein [Bacteroidota bacterium]